MSDYRSGIGDLQWVGTNSHPESQAVAALAQRSSPTVKDFLKVRPRKEEGAAKSANSARGSDAAKRKTSSGASAAKLFEKKVEMDPEERRKHEAAKKLQGLFKARIASKLRAEVQLFGMFNQCKQSMTNHWDAD